jgi:hypothetical protein
MSRYISKWMNQKSQNDLFGTEGVSFNYVNTFWTGMSAVKLVVLITETVDL